MGEHGTVCHGKTHSGAATHRFCGEKRFQDPVLHFLRDPAAGVGDPDHAIFFLRVKIRILRRICPEGIVHCEKFKSDHSFPFRQIFHGVPCIDQQIEESLLDLDHIAVDDEGGGRFDPGGIQSKGFARHEKFDGRFDQLCRIERCFCVISFPCESEHLFGQECGFPGDGIDLIQIPGNIFILRGVHIADNIQMSLNGMEIIIEVVSDPAGKFSDGFQPLIVFGFRAEQIQFRTQFHPFGHIPSEYDELEFLRILFLFFFLFFHELGKSQLHFFAGSFHIDAGKLSGSVKKFFGGFRQILKTDPLIQLACPYFHHFQSCLICLKDPAFQIQHDHHIHGIFKKQFVPFFCPAQIFFQFFGFAVISEKCKKNIQCGAVEFIVIQFHQIYTAHGAEPQYRHQFDQTGIQKILPPVRRSQMADHTVNDRIAQLHDHQCTRQRIEKTAFQVP